VAGTHSTGKSTFVAALRPRLEDIGLRVAIVHDSAADAQELGFGILADHGFDSTAWLIGNAIRAEAVASLHADAIIVDRPVPDALGYLLAALRHQRRDLGPGEYGRLEAVCRAWVGEYDLVFVTELDEGVPIGPGRPDDAAFRSAAALAIADVMRELAPGALPLRVGGVEGAIGTCIDMARARSGT